MLSTDISGIARNLGVLWKTADATNSGCERKRGTQFIKTECLQRAASPFSHPPHPTHTGMAPVGGSFIAVTLSMRGCSRIVTSTAGKGKE